MTNGGPTTLKSALKNTGSGDKQSKSVSFAQMGPRITVDTAPAQQWLLHGGLSHEAASRDPRAQMVVITAGHKQFYCCLDTLASRCGFFSGAMAAMKGKTTTGKTIELEDFRVDEAEYVLVYLMGDFARAVNTDFGKRLLDDEKFFATITRIYRLSGYFGIPDLRRECVTAVGNFTNDLQSYYHAHPSTALGRMTTAVNGFAQAVCFLHSPMPPSAQEWRDLRLVLVRFAKTFNWAFGKDARRPESGMVAGVEVVRKYSAFFDC